VFKLLMKDDAAMHERCVMIVAALLAALTYAVPSIGLAEEQAAIADMYWFCFCLVFI
jgi:hypothetical protein